MEKRNPRLRRPRRVPGSIALAFQAAALAAAARTSGGQPARRWVPRTYRAWVAAIPIVGVNAVAFYGQLAFFRLHLDAPPGIKILLSAVLESIAVYLACQAHLAQLADDSALRLRLSAYGIALLIGVMNYSHYMRPGWKPTVTAIAFGLCSVISPWLWSVHSRRESRDKLKAKGLIEDHAVRLGATRWTTHPWLSALVASRAAWAGEKNPARAIAMVTTPHWLQPPAEPELVLTPKPPPSVPVSGSREPRQSSRRAARKPGRTTARKPARAPSTGVDRELAAQLEREWAADLAAQVAKTGAPWPSARELSRTDERLSGNRRAAGRVLELAHAMSGDGDGVDRS